MENKIYSKLPTFIIVGANKGGTSSIHTYCKIHPQVVMSNIKEPMFFTNLRKDTEAHATTENEASLEKPFFVTGLENYANLFVGGEMAKARGEASTSYLPNYNRAISNMKKIIPDVKIIACLRNPTDRAFSNYLMYLSEGIEKRTFEESLLDEIKGVITPQGQSYLSLGMYYDSIKAYQESFGSENVLVVFYNNLKKCPKSFMSTIFRFIGVDDTLDLDFRYKANTAEERFSKISIQKPVISATEVDICHDFFKQDISKLKTIIDFGDISWDKT